MVTDNARAVCAEGALFYGPQVRGMRHDLAPKRSRMCDALHPVAGRAHGPRRPCCVGVGFFFSDTICSPSKKKKEESSARRRHRIDTVVPVGCSFFLRAHMRLGVAPAP